MTEIIEVALLMLSGFVGAILGTVPKAVLAGINIDHPFFLTISCIFGYVASVLSIVLVLYAFGIWKGLLIWFFFGIVISFSMKGAIVKWNGLASLLQIPFTTLIFVYLTIKYF